MPHSTSSTNIVAALFGSDQQAITEYLITVPAGMDEPTLVDQIILLARVEGVVDDSHGTITVAVRPADALDEDDAYETGVRPTMH